MTKSEILKWVSDNTELDATCKDDYCSCNCSKKFHELSAMLDKLIQSAPDRGAIITHLDEDGSLEERQEYVEVTNWQKEVSK